MTLQKYENIFNLTKNACKKITELDQNVKNIEEKINNKIDDLIDIQSILKTKYFICDKLENLDSIENILKTVKDDELIKILNQYRYIFKEILIIKENLKDASEKNHQTEMMLMMELYETSKNDIEKYIASSKDKRTIKYINKKEVPTLETSSQYEEEEEDNLQEVWENFLKESQESQEDNEIYEEEICDDEICEEELKKEEEINVCNFACRIVKRRNKNINVDSIFSVRHKARKINSVWNAFYDLQKKIISHGENTYRTPTGFCMSHYRQVRPEIKSCNGWKECEILVENEWMPFDIFRFLFFKE